ncbi:MAG: hypothetical protein D3923_09395 [Candidatus Electrothrix sp. AR3]|nr:hypothetical protein [Candidatus Electrothrix sp. AR3]
MKTDGARYFARNIVWRKTDDSEFPYVADGKHEQMKIRLNDFPAEPLYSLVINDAVFCDFDQWPPSWQREAQLKG